MAPKTIYESSLRAGGDLGAVFEWDGEAGYFYLCAMLAPDRPKILNRVHVLSGTCDFQGDDVEIRWDVAGNVVGLLIRGRPWAAFDAVSGLGHGGDYTPVGDANIPAELVAAVHLH